MKNFYEWLTESVLPPPAPARHVLPMPTEYNPHAAQQDNRRSKERITQILQQLQDSTDDYSRMAAFQVSGILSKSKGNYSKALTNIIKMLKTGFPTVYRQFSDLGVGPLSPPPPPNRAA